MALSVSFALAVNLDGIARSVSPVLADKAGMDQAVSIKHVIALMGEFQKLYMVLYSVNVPLKQLGTQD